MIWLGMFAGWVVFAVFAAAGVGILFLFSIHGWAAGLAVGAVLLLFAVPVADRVAHKVARL